MNQEEAKKALGAVKGHRGHWVLSHQEYDGGRLVTAYGAGLITASGKFTASGRDLPALVADLIARADDARKAKKEKKS